jgi:hypothetical protein
VYLFRDGKQIKYSKINLPMRELNHKAKGLRVREDSSYSEEHSTRVTSAREFDGSNYESWSTYIQNILSEKGLWDVIEENPMAIRVGENLESDTFIKRCKEYRKLDQKAKAKIGLRVNKRFSLIVNKSKTAHEALNTLKTFYYSLDQETIERLEQEFANARLKKGEDALTFLTRLQNMQERLNGTENNKISNSRLKNKVIQSLENINNRWAMFITTLRMDQSAMNNDDLFQTRIWGEWIRQDMRNQDQNEDDHMTGTFYAKREDKFEGKCNFCQKVGHKERDCNAKVKCNFCQKVGHKEQNCYAKQRGNKQTNNVTNKKKEKKHQLFQVETEDIKSQEWLIDSGASDSITCSETYLKNYVKNEENEYLYMANQAKTRILGRGDMKLTYDGETIYLRNVLHVPEVRKNLIAINQIDKEGYSILFKNGNVIIRKDEDIEMVKNKS